LDAETRVVDWDNIREHRMTPDKPDSWPEGVRGISLEGVSLLGIHEKTGALYWDGKEIVVRRAFRLGTFERWIAGVAALGAFGTFLVNLVRLLGEYGISLEGLAMSGKWLTSIGLVLDIIGVCILFKYGFPQPDFGEAVLLATEQTDPEAPRKRKLWTWMSAVGLVCLVGGFGLQLWGTWK
jgi:hypothetical protein